MVCTTCEDLGKSKPKSFYKSSPFEGRRECASENACYYCLLLLDAIAALKLPRNRRIITIIISRSQIGFLDLRLIFDPYLVLNYTFYASNGIVSQAFDSFTLLVKFTGSSWLYSDLKGPKPTAPDTGSEEALSWALKSYLNCLTGHPALCGVKGAVEMPSRLVDVGYNPNHRDDVRLCDSLGVKERYICLSHCWGGGSPISLTSFNEAEFLQKIEWKSIPRTFQDAITFTRQLNISYIWIDSLCIIQNQRSDWHRESKKMGLVYRNATLTLAATAAIDSNVGLFRRHNAYDSGVKVGDKYRLRLGGKSKRKSLRALFSRNGLPVTSSDEVERKPADCVTIS